MYFVCVKSIVASRCVAAELLTMSGDGLGSCAGITLWAPKAALAVYVLTAETELERLTGQPTPAYKRVATSLESTIIA